MNNKETNNGINRIGKLLPMADLGAACCSGSENPPINPPILNQAFVTGAIKTPTGEEPQVSSSLTGIDRIGSFKARWGIGRMHYVVAPGLYALGTPDEDSNVLVTANYKMSFDRLREALPERNLWILVLDTKGINVWCAAGKGTFGTENLVQSIKANHLDLIVSHWQLLLPQLGAPGIASHKVKKLSGFNVIYGPIKASDLPEFLDNGMKATEEMRIKTFPISERIALIPIELVAGFKATVIATIILLIIRGLVGPAQFFENIIYGGLLIIITMLTALFAGAILTPALLPWLPGRAFSLKGLIVSITMIIVLLICQAGDYTTIANIIESTGLLLLIPASAMYLAMNFTGASTYTSLSGVRKEMKWAVPVEIGFGTLGIILWLIGMLLS